MAFPGTGEEDCGRALDLAPGTLGPAPAICLGSFYGAPLASFPRVGGLGEAGSPCNHLPR